MFVARSRLLAVLVAASVVVLLLTALTAGRRRRLKSYARPTEGGAAAAAALVAVEESPAAPGQAAAPPPGAVAAAKTAGAKQEPCSGVVEVGKHAGRPCMRGWEMIRDEKGLGAADTWCRAVGCGVPIDEGNIGVVDIDIGTLGSPMASSIKLITFDPFDKYLKRSGFERFPTAISANDGAGDFCRCVRLCRCVFQGSRV